MAHIIYTYKGRVINLSTLAEKLKKMKVSGASLSNLSRVFSGRHRPRLDLALAIAKLGNIPLDEIDAMLAHTAKQRQEWRYAPVFGQVRPVTPIIALADDAPSAYGEEGIDEVKDVGEKSR